MLSRLLRQYSENGLLVTMTVGRAAARYRMRTLIGRYPGRRVQLLPTSQDGTAELKVGPHEKVAVVLTGEAGCTPVMALEARTENQPAAFAGLEAHQRGHRNAAAGSAVNRTTGVLPVGCGTRVHARCDVIETAASSSKSAAAVVLPAGQVYFPQPAAPASSRSTAGQAADTTSRAAAATPTLRGSTNAPQLITISNRTHESVHRSFAQPCAIAPSSNKGSSTTRSLSPTFGHFAGPQGRRACCPPSRHDRRHHSTGRTLTPDPQFSRDHRALLTPRKAVDQRNETVK